MTSWIVDTAFSEGMYLISCNWLIEAAMSSSTCAGSKLSGKLGTNNFHSGIPLSSWHSFDGGFAGRDLLFQ